MSDSEVKIKVTANAEQAKAELAAVGKAAGEVGKKAKYDASAAHGAVLQLSGSVLSLKNGLAALASGRGGVGAILQVAGAARSASGALKVAGGAGAVAAAGVAAGFAAAAAAAVGVGTEVAKASMGTEAWRKNSVDAIESVIGWLGRAGDAWKSFLKQTAIGQTLDERAKRKTQEEIAVNMREIDERNREAGLNGLALREELGRAVDSGDVEKATRLYAKREEEKKRQAEADQETRNIREANSPEAARAREEGRRLEREGKAMEVVRAVDAETAKTRSRGQQQALDRLADLARRGRGGVEANPFSDEPGAEGYKRKADPNAMRWAQNNIVNLAQSGVAMESIVAALERSGWSSEDVVTSLETLQNRLPQGFADELLKHIKPGVIAWQ